MASMRNKINKLREEIDKYLPQAPDIKQKILVIDDDYRNLRSFKGLFRKQALVFTAENLEEALYHMRNNKIDIVFCDYKMPKMKGDDVLKEIVKELVVLYKNKRITGKGLTYLQGMRKSILNHDCKITQEEKDKVNVFFSWEKN